MAKKGELSFRAYKHEVQVSCLQIMKYQKVMKDKNVLLVKNGVKILKLESDLLYKSKKLKKLTTIALSRGKELPILNK